MGVMECYRKKCTQIMCDTYIDDIGYICHECQDEFKLYLQSRGIEPKNEREIKTHLEIFMKENKGMFDEKEISVDDFFKEHSKD